MQGGIPAVLIYEDLEYLSPYMHTENDVVGVSLNSPQLLEASARLAASSIMILAGGFEGPSSRFLRGDADARDGLNIADAIVTLSWLFAKGAEPPCLEALDVNDDGGVDISDPVRLLLWLFVAAPQPPAPFETCGLDPTPDPLGCASFAPCLDAGR